MIKKPKMWGLTQRIKNVKRLAELSFVGFSFFFCKLDPGEKETAPMRDVCTCVTNKSESFLPNCQSFVKEP